MSVYDAVEFAENPEPRCPCVLLLDVSGSMGGRPIAALNQGLQAFQNDLMGDDLASKRVEIAIVTFGAGVQVVQDFVTADQLQAPTLSVAGTTPMGAGIHQALDMVRDRKATYKTNNVAYYRPWIFLITDGGPTDEWQSAAQRVKQEEQAKSVAFFGVGVQGADMGVLGQISSRQPLMLQGLKFIELFVWLSKSTQSVSHSKVGEQVPLQPPSGWAEV